MDQNEQILTGRFPKKEYWLNVQIWIIRFLALMMAAATLGSFFMYWKYPCWVHQIFPNPSADYAIGLSVTLASLSGVLLVYLAFLGQRLQMIYQQQDLRDNREEMKNSTAQLKIQAEALTSQISRMDRDFIHQNFFRILEHHFTIRDNIDYTFYKNTGEKSNTEQKGVPAFSLYLKKVVKWADDNSGWNQKKNLLEKDSFLLENQFPWTEKRPEIEMVGTIDGKRFRSQSDPETAITKEELAFLLRVCMTEKSFGAYQRSCYYLFNYMKDNKLEQYLDAVDAGMGLHERVFLFYQIATRFEVDDRLDVKHWLMDHKFLKTIYPKHLLASEHYELLYSILAE